MTPKWVSEAMIATQPQMQDGSGVILQKPPPSAPASSSQFLKSPVLLVSIFYSLGKYNVSLTEAMIRV